MHGAACSAWEQIPPPGLLERRESEMSEEAHREATGGTRLMGEIGLVMIVAGIVALILLLLYCHSSLYHPVKAGEIVVARFAPGVVMSNLFGCGGVKGPLFLIARR